MASDRRIRILIPAAGESARYREEGYDLPKHMLRVTYGGINGTMLGHVLEYVPKDMDVLVGVRQAVPDLHPRVMTTVVEHTAGQADTVRQMLEEVDIDDGVIVMDCDTLVLKEDVYRIRNLMAEWSAVVLVAENRYDRSMSRVDHVPHPTVFVEKKDISQWGVVSVRAFHNAGLLRGTLRQVVDEHRQIGTEPYLSHVLNRYPGTKYALVTKEYTDWGVPEKLRRSGAVIEEEIQ